MNNSIQLYEKIVRLKPASPKGGGNLPPPFTAKPAAHSTLREIRKVDSYLAQGGRQLVHPLCFDEMVPGGAR